MYSKKIINKARRLYLDGLPTRDIAKKIGCGSGTVWEWCEDITRKPGYHNRGKKHWNYKGGSINKNGYKVIWVDRKLVLKHRYLMEEHLKRKLDREEIVHHLNGDRLDNKLENLLIMTNSSHTNHHLKEKKEYYWNSPYLNTTDLAKRFGVCNPTINNWRRRGLPFYKRLSSKMFLFLKRDVDYWVKKNIRLKKVKLKIEDLE